MAHPQGVEVSWLLMMLSYYTKSCVRLQKKDSDICAQQAWYHAYKCRETWVWIAILPCKVSSDFSWQEIFLLHTEINSLYSQTMFHCYGSETSSVCCMFPHKLSSLGKGGREDGHIKREKKKERKKISINYFCAMFSWLLLASCLYGFQLRTQGKMGLIIFPAISFNWNSLFIRSKQTQGMHHFGGISISSSWNALSAFKECRFFNIPNNIIVTILLILFIWEPSNKANK